jgi:hypothetical protein
MGALVVTGCANLSQLSTGMPDAESEPDGRVDAGNDVQTPTWCNRADGGLGHQFCADFDEGQLPQNWDSLDLSDGGGGSLDDANPLSAPFSFRCGLAASGGSAVPIRARLQKSFPQPTSSIDLTFGILADALADAGVSSFVAFAGTGFTFLLQGLSSQGISLEQFSVATDGTATNLSATIPTNTPLPAAWTTVEILVSLGGATDTVTLKVDGKVLAADKPLAMPLTGTFFLGLGLSATSANAATAHFDDVTVDIH